MDGGVGAALRPPGQAEPLPELAAAPVELLIVGGGIVGAGIARDAALRGLRPVLVEQYDFAFGTSSRSSRLLHGGLRYLAQGHVGLVHEASREKALLAGLAPHLCQPLPFLFPARRGDPWPFWQLRLGVRLYDLLTRDRRFPASRALSPAAVHDLVPLLEPRGLAGAVQYTDALTHDARLVLDTLRSAAAAGARLANYVRCTGAERQGEGWVVALTDTLSGATTTVRARCVVNAAGAWAPRLPPSTTRLRPTKGIHLVVDRERLPLPCAVVMSEGRRILFALPWGERTILGTTDTDYAGDLDAPGCDEGDIDYVLAVTRRHFPAAELGRADIRSTWAGLRPLVARRGGAPSDISRAHTIHSPAPGWWDVTGGKLTIYRRMAEQTVDRLARQLGRSLPPSPSAAQPLVPEPGYSAIVPPPPSQAAVRHFVQHEWAVHLDDVLLRRTSWHHYLADDATNRQVAAWLATEARWDTARQTAEWQRFQAIVAEPPRYAPGLSAAP